jgi:hypothetical protein
MGGGTPLLCAPGPRQVYAGVPGQRRTMGCGQARSSLPVLAGDSLPLARVLAGVFGWAAALRAAILRDRPGPQRLAWIVRQQVWAAVWSFIVVSRLWPRRTPVPGPVRDTTIDLIAAPDTYGDFRSPALVVPSDIPGGASRLAALLIARLCPINSRFAPCDPGAAPGIFVTESLTRDTSRQPAAGSATGQFHP